MRKLILSMQISLDGFVVGENNDMHWIATDTPEIWDDLFDMLEDVDLFLLGRGMYAGYRDYWKKALGVTDFSENEVKYARLAATAPHIVFSSTLKDPQWENTRIMNGNVVEEVRKLKQQEGKSIQIVGGAQLASTLLEAGLVDEYKLTVNPIIVGKGKSLFQNITKQRELELLEIKQMPGGVVVLRYRSTYPNRIPIGER
ncbi:dihydrofolate reductase family protein [Parachryseolinea silvisoli]|uniref:dihydrofolate reductase family protein n=1 Tax=Parachryseolinea silvisoli TaxID=2873601 RepID=UPI00226590AE|nr:dihydrofolate reductase family protein [Parachryseolinea silvisoli]MCD9015417.1 dihydrofolate reductase family protein [Parachryseolinea silvisoli]